MDTGRAAGCVPVSHAVKDFEDVFLLGTMVTGQLLSGLCFVLVYRLIRKRMAAVQNLHVMIDGLGRAAGSQTLMIPELKSNTE